MGLARCTLNVSENKVTKMELKNAQPFGNDRRLKVLH